ncbi:MAG: hypothetical protein JW723_11900 [Bacteroidales bacterium]|nr:hypothetical protein [Bacteroidales bacterium]
MKILHTKLKDIILQTIMKHALSLTDRSGNARQGAQDLFDLIKEQINEEIYLLYLAKCQEEFFNEYSFEDAEPFIKGMMEARYCIIRMFHISFCEYFELFEKCCLSTGIGEKNTIKKSKISA